MFHIDAKGKIGEQIGAALGKAVKAQFPDIEQKIDKYLKSLVSSHKLAYMIRKWLSAIRSAIDQKYIDEVEAMASLLVNSDKDDPGDGYLSLNEFWFFQLTPDIVGQNSGSGFGVFGEASASGTPLVGSNMDRKTDKALRTIQAVTLYQYEKSALVNIGFAGYLGVVTGFNDNGLFAAHLDSPMGLPYPDKLEGRYSAVFDIRKVLETCGSVSSAANLMAKQICPFSHNVLLADQSKIAVLEHPRGKAARVRIIGSPLRTDISWDKLNQIAVVNFFALRRIFLL